MKLSPSTKRAVRTALQLVAAILVVSPLLATVLAGTPLEGQLAAVVAAAALVAKAVNALEDAGLIPAWLKDDPATKALHDEQLIAEVRELQRRLDRLGPDVAREVHRAVTDGRRGRS